MNTVILILTLISHVNSGAVSSMVAIEFRTQDACEVAGKFWLVRINEQRDVVYADALCVRK